MASLLCSGRKWNGVLAQVSTGTRRALSCTHRYRFAERSWPSIPWKYAELIWLSSESGLSSKWSKKNVHLACVGEVSLFASDIYVRLCASHILFGFYSIVAFCEKCSSLFSVMDEAVFLQVWTYFGLEKLSDFCLSV